MKLPLQITFRNAKSSGIVEQCIRTEAAKLETFYNQIMACRVAVEIPHRHHRKGKAFHVRIDLTLPGKEIVIKREPNLVNHIRKVGETQVTKHMEVGSPHNDVRLAIHDAFKAAGRRLQDFARLQRGDVKRHKSVPVAVVSKILPDEGYGFLAAEGGREIYFHKQSVLNRGFYRLRVGTPVSFSEEQGEKGPQATTVRLIRKRRSRVRESLEQQIA
jgi:cold shock CspA family protein/ribosome-associated translation inhibitor RaiA